MFWSLGGHITLNKNDLYIFRFALEFPSIWWVRLLHRVNFVIWPHWCHITKFDPQKNSPENLRANSGKIISQYLKISEKPAIYVLTGYFRYTGAGNWNPTHPKLDFETLLGTSKNKFRLLMRRSPGIGTTKIVLAGCAEVKSRQCKFI